VPLPRQPGWCYSTLGPGIKASPYLEAGVDEAGRGPLAGPVVVAAVILPENYDLKYLDDSKRLSALKREQLAPQIEEIAIAFAVEFVEVAEIDRVNILQATLNGMQRAVENLDPAPQRAVIDGNRAPPLSCEVKTVIGGDRLVASISAASILAKVYRDRLMQSLHCLYPDYGFDRHKGYPTAHHLACLREFGPCPIHRRSFAPVRKASAGQPYSESINVSISSRVTGPK
jgi:ribonuclease HII